MSSYPNRKRYRSLRSSLAPAPLHSLLNSQRKTLMASRDSFLLKSRKGKNVKQASDAFHQTTALLHRVVNTMRGLRQQMH